MVGICSTHRRDDTCKQILVVKPEGKRSLGRHRRRWEDNIKTGFRKVWTGFMWLRIGTNVGLCEHGNEP
jgi:hypothetical protein